MPHQGKNKKEKQKTKALSPSNNLQIVTKSGRCPCILFGFQLQVLLLQVHSFLICTFFYRAVTLFSFLKKKKKVTEAGETEGASNASSLSKWPQQPGLDQLEIRSFIWICEARAEAQACRPTSVVSLGAVAGNLSGCGIQSQDSDQHSWWMASIAVGGLTCGVIMEPEALLLPIIQSFKFVILN